METLVDSSSPRRGSLSSLHRQSSGSSHYSHNSKLASPGNNNNNTTNNNQTPINPNPYKDLDKFTRYFIIKTVQVIVQSRIGGAGANGASGNARGGSDSGSANVRMECKPSGNDWFNINISDIPEVRDITKAALDTQSFTVKSNWRVCCEISLRTNDNTSVVLEHWIISNKSITNHPTSTNLLLSSTKLSLPQNLGSPKSPQNINRNSSPTNNSASNLGNTQLSAINSTQQSPTRVRTATFSNTLRTRLNSIDDCSGDKSYLVNRMLVDANNENVDFKASKSCYSLSNSPAINQTADQNNATNVITPSPSINSLPNNNNPALYQSSLNNNPASATTSTTNTSNSHAQGAIKSSSSSSIYTIYNRMSLLLKTLMTTTHIVPAYRLASRTSPKDSCVICYRVYTCPPSSYQNSRLNRGSIEDINYNSASDSPNKRSSSSNSSFDSLNIRDFVSVEELDYFCPILKLGSVKTDINELDVSVCYRTDVRNSSQLLKSPRSREIYDRIADEDCIIAAKQLLAGNELASRQRKTHNEVETQPNDNRNHDTLDYLDRPLRPAFALTESKIKEFSSDPNLELVESAFDGLLKINHQDDDEESQYDTTKNGFNTNGQHHHKNLTAQSKPIQVPKTKRAKRGELYSDLSVDSTPKSLSDSYVFVDLNPPFASDEQNDIASFFHGPSPAFSNGFDSLKDVDELANQLADIEANASQLDEFVDNICMSDQEDDEKNDE